jgi:hypothetical protein
MRVIHRDISRRDISETVSHHSGYGDCRLKGFNVIDSHGSVAEIGRTQTFEWDTGWFRWTHCALIAEVASATSSKFLSCGKFRQEMGHQVIAAVWLDVW